MESISNQKDWEIFGFIMVSVDCITENVGECHLILIVKVRIRTVTSIIHAAYFIKELLESFLIYLIANRNDFGSSLLQKFDVR
jgi:hypothetical protein